MFSTVAIASTLLGLAAAAPVHKATSETDLTVTHFRSTHFEGSCGWTNRTNQYIASVYTNSSDTKEGALCGRTINVTSSWSGLSVLAQVVDERTDVASTYLNLSRAAFEEVAPASYGHFIGSYTLVEEEKKDSKDAAPVHKPVAAPKKDEEDDELSTPAAPKKVQDHTSTSTSKEPEHTSTSSSSKKAESTPTSSEKHEEAAPKWTPSSSSSSSSSKKVEAAPQWTPSSSSKKEEATPQWTPASSSKKEEAAPQWTPSSSSKKEEAAWTPAYTPPSTKAAEPAYTPQAQPQSSGQYSGQATYFYQGGNPGNCGSVNSDGTYLVALSLGSQYAGGSHCGQSVRITNTANGRTITAFVADSCPGCGYGSLDLSVGAFQGLGDMSQGVLPISWSWA